MIENIVNFYEKLKEMCDLVKCSTTYQWNKIIWVVGTKIFPPKIRKRWITSHK